jgi:hypothetical protein
MTTEHFMIPICRHLKTNGLRCQSPALNGETFCYFHLRLHKHHPAPLTAREIVNARNLQYEGYEDAVIGAGEDPMQIARAYPRQNEFNFPPLEDAESIQLAASMLFHAIAQGQVHLRRARILRDILCVANNSCRRASASPADPGAFVRQIDQTPDGTAIAAAGPVQPAPATSQLTGNEEFAANPIQDKILQMPVSQVLPNEDFAIFSPLIEPASSHATGASS